MVKFKFHFWVVLALVEYAVDVTALAQSKSIPGAVRAIDSWTENNSSWQLFQPPRAHFDQNYFQANDDWGIEAHLRTPLVAERIAVELARSG